MKKFSSILLPFVTILAVSAGILEAGGDPLGPGSVIFQTFYWDVPTGGIWWDRIRDEAPGLKSAGFSHFWFPPPTKGAAGGYSMGYDLYDNYDLGNYDQKGTVETRFGSLSELQAAAAACGNVLLDLVANHMTGAEGWCQDPGDGQWYPQAFQYVHDRFWKGCMDFHGGWPDDCDLCNGQDYIGMEDVCHNSSWMFDGQLEWARWMRDTVGNVSGFRLDAVKHFKWEMSAAFGTVGSCIGEYWDSKDNIQNWMWATGNYAFDFPLYEAMKGNADALDEAGLISDKGVSFVANHDTDGIWHKSRAYGFIMYITPIPCVFWSDWFNDWLRPHIRRALAARTGYDFNGTRTIYKRTDLIIFDNNAGVLGCFNSAGGTSSASVRLNPNYRYTAVAWGPGDKPGDVVSDSEGDVTLSAPGEGYCYWYGFPNRFGCQSKYSAVYVPGSSEEIFGTNWYFSSANRMTLVDDYTWRWVANIPEPTSVEYKFAMDDSWDVNRGLGKTSGVSAPQKNSYLIRYGPNIAANLPKGICVWEYREDTETSRLFTVDFDASGSVTFADFAAAAEYWMNEDCSQPDWCGGADVTMGGTVNYRDLAEVIRYYLTEPAQ
ncbi:MAG: hypothetical protein JW720_09100 [Sedimentisphaerales bacterium]|nr:hypothetical protein [Sedimentisphaerales bacterium]